MYFSIRHVTRFQYSAPVSESNMEVRMRPRTEANQRCLKFDLHITPRAKANAYKDHNSNTVHYFDVPGHHTKLTLVAESVVEVDDPAPLPAALPASAWEDVDEVRESAEFWELQNPSLFAKPTEMLIALARELRVERREDPLTLLREINSSLFETFEYTPKHTRVDSPIDEAIGSRKGVCQDYAHVMIALVRHLGIPCRYVSGYLFPRTKLEERSALGATHAWLEAYLQGIGWIGFDPTNNELCDSRHIRTAVGTDYADVPPTKGVFKGRASSELSVAVRVQPTDAPTDEKDEFIMVVAAAIDVNEVDIQARDARQQQQQQQQ
ncbi:MAG: transglutaminase domain-containing protein [Bryobacteraceae bacterium]